MNKRNAILALLAAALVLSILSIVLQHPDLDGGESWKNPTLQTSTAIPTFDSSTSWWTDMPTPPGALASPTPTYTSTP